ncbi:MAG: protein kinase [Candidatus Accumulibacter phosphatis]|jgi:serine/threonine protein kinase
MIDRFGSPGSANDEAFELLQHLGGGGFANTWKAKVLDEDLIEDFRTNVVALKIPSSRKKERVLRKELELNAALRAQLRGLKSTNLVRYLGFDVFRNQIVMAMEYVPGGSLRQLVGAIGRQRQLAVDRALQIAEGTLNGLVSIHAEQVLHRDIKPENILMDGDEPKLADFGISRMLDPDQKASTGTGTLPYMSPEQLYGKASFPSDQWSFGVTFYEMLTGTLPWNEVELLPLSNEICNRYPRPPIEIRPEIPQSINDFILKALKKAPADRFANAEVMLEVLRKAIRGTTTGELDKAIDRVRQLVADYRDSDDVEKELGSLLAKYPHDARFYQHLGEFNNRRQSYDKAIAVFEKGIAVIPDSAVLHWDLALALQRKGQRRLSAEHLRRAIALGLDASMSRYAQTLLRSLDFG